MRFLAWPSESGSAECCVCQNVLEAQSAACVEMTWKHWVLRVGQHGMQCEAWNADEYTAKNVASWSSMAGAWSWVWMAGFFWAWQTCWHIEILVVCYTMHGLHGLGLGQSLHGLHGLHCLKQAWCMELLTKQHVIFSTEQAAD